MSKKSENLNRTWTLLPDPDNLENSASKKDLEEKNDLEFLDQDLINNGSNCANEKTFTTADSINKSNNLISPTKISYLTMKTLNIDMELVSMQMNTWENAFKSIDDNFDSILNEVFM